MDDKLLRFFKKIGFNDIVSFENASFDSCIIHKKTNTWTIKINAPEIIPVSSMMSLKKLCLEGLDDVNSIDIVIKYENLNPELVLEYFNYFFKKIVKEQISLSGIDTDLITITDDTINVDVTSTMERTIIKNEEKKILKDLSDVGITGFNIKCNINDVERQAIKKIIKKTKEEVVVPIPIVNQNNKDQKWVPKKKVEYQREGVVPISTLVKEENAVNLEAYIIDTEGLVRQKKTGGEFYLINLKISDNTSSILGKYFASDEEDYGKVMKELKKGNWYHFTGQVRDDQYAHDLVFNMRTYEGIDSPIVVRKDDYPEKRVEMHAHTMMSQMDGVIDEEKLVDTAIRFGHKGIAITDHDGCQAFPHVFDKVTKYNKSKKKEFDEKIKENENTIEELKESGNIEGIKALEEMNEELRNEKKNYVPFKAAYGVELDMFDSYLNVCFNADSRPLKDQTYVVFDTETTGFNPGIGDSMIEIGGVKIKDGEVIDRFDELINPGHHIDEAITRVTNISDDDVKDADNELNVTKRFKEWIEDLPLVAHNAKFDKNMLDMAYLKYDLGPLKNPIIDTLNLSRVINRDLKRHSLAALGKNYGVDTGEGDNDDEEDNSENSQFEISDEIASLIQDVKLDGESILNVTTTEKDIRDASTETVVKGYKKNYGLIKKYIGSKTEYINFEVFLNNDDFSVISQTGKIKLNPAENNIPIVITNGLQEYKIDYSIYVGQHHGADVDSENTALIFNSMLKQIDGIKTLNELNDLGLLESISIKNNPRYLKNIQDMISYKNYIKIKMDSDTNKENPFEDYGVEGYSWKFDWCHKDNLQMYENIPAETFTENIANDYDSVKHITIIAKNHAGLKNLFKIISFANTNFLSRNARIPRRLVNDLRENCFVGSACLNGEIFNIALTRGEEELKKAMEFYDYIEIQPLDNYKFLIDSHDINNMNHLVKLVKKIIKCAKETGKMLIASGDVHNLNPEDVLSREIIVNQNVPGKGRHVLAKCLKSKPKTPVNKTNLEDAIKKAERNGVVLSDLDKKILKYIYVLNGFKSIPISAMNILSIYSTPKELKSSDELELIKSEDDKKSAIEKSLRKLQIANIITIDPSTGTFKLLAKFSNTGVTQHGSIPNQYFRTTKEMLDAFAFLKDDKLVHEMVIDNPNKIISELEEIEVIDYPEKPYSPIIEHSQEICRDLVFDKAHSMYGDPLPRNIEERIAQEFYGDKITGLVKARMEEEYPNMSEEERDNMFSSYLHDVIMSGYDGVVKLKTEEVKKEEPELSEEEAVEKAKLKLTGIIGGGFDVIYLIAQKLVKHSNDDGFLVGSRGSVGSSFVASMMGITECNGLPAHYYCPKCCHNEFVDSEGHPYAEKYASGYDLPNKNCPECGTLMIHQGNDMPFATFLGFAGEKVPDIDLNFSGLNQASAHAYTKVLFGTDNVYRAGTIGTVADKTAFGYVQGFYEDQEYNDLVQEAKMYGVKISSKDDLKKKKLIKCDIRDVEVERQAIGCTGVKRTTGQHPGGIVVVPGYKDVWDFTPFQYPADDPTAEWRTTHFDYHKIEADLLKLDILGHDDPTVLRKLGELSGIDVNDIDLGDLDTMSIFTSPKILGKYTADGNPIDLEPTKLRGLIKDGVKYCPTGTLGIPEFGTPFTLGMLEDTKPTTFGELIKISGLSHGTDVWLGNAKDLCTPNEEGVIQVPFKNVIGCRDDIMVNLIAWGLPAGKAFKIMEFVRKGRPSKDPATWKEHAEYMREHNIPEWYIESCRKIKYMFPKAHATAYVTSAFRIAWFKVHHPIWYYCAYLSIRRDKFDVASMIQGEKGIRDKIDEMDLTPNLSDVDKDKRDTLLLCLEMCARGFYFKNIDIEKSEAKDFVITEDGKGLIIPFCAIDGLGENVAMKIIEERKKMPFISQEDLHNRGKCPTSAMEKLKELGVFQNLSESNQLSLF